MINAGDWLIAILVQWLLSIQTQTCKWWRVDLKEYTTLNYFKVSSSAHFALQTAFCCCKLVTLMETYDFWLLCCLVLLLAWKRDNMHPLETFEARHLGRISGENNVVIFPRISITVSPLWKLKRETRHPSCYWMQSEFWMAFLQLPVAIGKSQPSHFLCRLSKAFSRVTSARNTRWNAQASAGKHAALQSGQKHSCHGEQSTILYLQIYYCESMRRHVSLQSFFTATLKLIAINHPLLH